MSMHPWFAMTNGSNVQPVDDLDKLIKLRYQQEVMKLFDVKPSEIKKPEEPKKPTFNYLKILVILTLCFPFVAGGYFLATIKMLQVLAQAAKPFTGTN